MMLWIQLPITQSTTSQLDLALDVVLRISVSRKQPELSAQVRDIVSKALLASVELPVWANLDTCILDVTDGYFRICYRPLSPAAVKKSSEDFTDLCKHLETDFERVETVFVHTPPHRMPKTEFSPQAPADCTASQEVNSTYDQEESAPLEQAFSETSQQATILYPEMAASTPQCSQDSLLQSSQTEGESHVSEQSQGVHALSDTLQEESVISSQPQALSGVSHNPPSLADTADAPSHAEVTLKNVLRQPAPVKPGAAFASPAVAFEAFSVLDGFGRPSAPLHASKTLVAGILAALDGSKPIARARKDASDEQLGFALQVAFMEALPKALLEGYSASDADLRDHLKEEGTMATVAFVCGRQLVVATAGSSCAYLDTGAHIYPATIPEGGARLIMASGPFWDVVTPSQDINNVRKHTAKKAPVKLQAGAVKQGLKVEPTVFVVDLAPATSAAGLVDQQKLCKQKQAQVTLQQQPEKLPKQVPEVVQPTKLTGKQQPEKLPEQQQAQQPAEQQFKKLSAVQQGAQEVAQPDTQSVTTSQSGPEVGPAMMTLPPSLSKSAKRKIAQQKTARNRATFGWAVLDQEQLLERAPRQKARRERKQQGLSRSVSQAAPQMFDTDCGKLQLPLYPSGPHCILRSIAELQHEENVKAAEGQHEKMQHAKASGSGSEPEVQGEAVATKVVMAKELNPDSTPAPPQSPQAQASSTLHQSQGLHSGSGGSSKGKGGGHGVSQPLTHGHNAPPPGLAPMHDTTTREHDIATTHKCGRGGVIRAPPGLQQGVNNHWWGSDRGPSGLPQRLRQGATGQQQDSVGASPKLPPGLPVGTDSPAASGPEVGPAIMTSKAAPSKSAKRRIAKQNTARNRATFGCAVLEQEQLLERAPKEKARRERKQQAELQHEENVKAAEGQHEKMKHAKASGCNPEPEAQGEAVATQVVNGGEEHNPDSTPAQPHSPQADSSATVHQIREPQSGSRGGRKAHPIQQHLAQGHITPPPGLVPVRGTIVREPASSPTRRVNAARAAAARATRPNQVIPLPANHQRGQSDSHSGAQAQGSQAPGHPLRGHGRARGHKGRRAGHGSGPAATHGAVSTAQGSSTNQALAHKQRMTREARQLSQQAAVGFRPQHGPGGVNRAPPGLQQGVNNHWWRSDDRTPGLPPGLQHGATGQQQGSVGASPKLPPGLPVGTSSTAARYGTHSDERYKQ
ncbi:hypothetical protein WJX79_003113 [Trebouxia sp. C0005]